MANVASFKKLLESVRKSNPDLITEEAAEKMLGEYEAGIDQIKKDAIAEGQSLGFKEGYDEGKAVAEETAKKEQEKLVAQLDEDATNKLKSVVETINDEHADKLQKVVDFMKSKTVPVEEYNALDEEAAKTLTEMANNLKKINEDKIKIATESIKNKYSKKLENRESFNKKKLKKVKLILEERVKKAKKDLIVEKNRKLNILAESVEKYLAYALDKAIPTKQLISEQKYKSANKAIEKITSILKINNVIQESKDGIFNDYENKIERQQKEANKLLVENTSLKATIKKQEAKLLLEEKIQKCIPAEAAFLRAYFKGADSKKIIEEQIEDAKNAFKTLHAERRRSIVQEQSKKVKTTPSAVVNEQKEKKKDSKQIVEESVKETKTQHVTSNFNEDNIATVYADMLRKNY